MVKKAWKKIVNEGDYKLWYNTKSKRKVSVFKNTLSTQLSPAKPSRRYILKDKSASLKRAKAYMTKN